jgi:antitoxin ParD1/3/4
MPSRNIHLTEELDEFIADSIKNGQYANASEVVRAGLLTLRVQAEIHTAKVEALRSAILHGMDSGVAEGDVIGRIRERIRTRTAGGNHQRVSA